MLQSPFDLAVDVTHRRRNTLKHGGSGRRARADHRRWREASEPRNAEPEVRSNRDVVNRPPVEEVTLIRVGDAGHECVDRKSDRTVTEVENPGVDSLVDTEPARACLVVRSRDLEEVVDRTNDAFGCTDD